MKKFIIFYIIMMMLSNIVHCIPFDGFIWVDLTQSEREKHITVIVVAVYDFTQYVDVQLEVLKKCKIIIKALKNKTAKDIVKKLNSFYRNREDLYIQVVEALYLICCDIVNPKI